MDSSKKSVLCAPKNIERATSLEIFSFACAFAAFFPALLWLFGALIQSRQLRDGVVILVTALLVLGIEYNIKPHRPLFHRVSALWLLGGYSAILSSGFFGIWGVFLTLGGLSAALVSLGLSCFDKRRYVYAAGGAFYAFTILSFFIGAFDLPLRVLAGRLSAWIISFFNGSVALMACGGDSPQIALKVGGASYLVATECNGFGIISGCIVLSLVSAIFRKHIGLFKRILIVLVGGLLAYVLNSIRIATIIGVAPFIAHSRYYLMHETFGYIFFAIALIAVWKISRKF